MVRITSSFETQKTNSFCCSSWTFCSSWFSIVAPYLEYVLFLISFGLSVGSIRSFCEAREGSGACDLLLLPCGYFEEDLPHSLKKFSSPVALLC